MVQDAIISVYRVGPMVDLCSGPHVPDTSLLKAVALTSTSRAFWRADTNKDALQVHELPMYFLSPISLRR
jgi:threonyl-tRNA synthetase